MAAKHAATSDERTVSLTCVPTSRRVWKALSSHWRELLQSMHDGDGVSGFKLEILSLLCEIHEKVEFSASEASAQLQVTHSAHSFSESSLEHLSNWSRSFGCIHGKAWNKLVLMQNFTDYGAG